MIHVPTDVRVHLLFDVAAWASAALLARFLYRWRLKDHAAEVAAKMGVGYAFALAAGAIAGAWVFGSINTGLTRIPHPSHSIAGALAGGIVAVEIWKLARGVRVSTGAIWI